MNSVTLTGNLGKDVSVKYTQSGKAVASFSIAVTEKWTADGEKKERTDWFNITAWNKRGELCGEYLSKGSKVLVQGKLQTRSYDDKSGNKRYVTEIVAATVEFLSARKSSGDSSGGGTWDESGRSQDSGSSAGSGAPLYDDIPFAP